jgi:hypothetical protein
MPPKRRRQPTRAEVVAHVHEQTGHPRQTIEQVLDAADQAGRVTEEVDERELGGEG